MLFIIVSISLSLSLSLSLCRPSPDNSSIGNDTSPLLNKDVVELVHTTTLKLLNSHDVAAPLTPANQEVAGYVNYSAKFVPYLRWRIVSFVGWIE